MKLHILNRAKKWYVFQNIVERDKFIEHIHVLPQKATMTSMWNTQGINPYRTHPPNPTQTPLRPKKVGSNMGTSQCGSYGNQGQKCIYPHEMRDCNLLLRDTSSMNPLAVPNLYVKLQRVVRAVKEDTTNNTQQLFIHFELSILHVWAYDECIQIHSHGYLFIWSGPRCTYVLVH